MDSYGFREVQLRYRDRLGKDAGTCRYLTRVDDDGIADEVTQKMRQCELPGMWAYPGIEVSVEVVGIDKLSGVTIVPDSWLVIPQLDATT